jgi:hypothetical protein
MRAETLHAQTQPPRPGSKNRRPATRHEVSKRFIKEWLTTDDKAKASFA